MTKLLTMTIQEIREQHSIIIKPRPFTLPHNIKILTQINDLGIFEKCKLGEIFNVSTASIYKMLIKLKKLELTR